MSGGNFTELGVLLEPCNLAGSGNLSSTRPRV